MCPVRYPKRIYNVLHNKAFDFVSKMLSQKVVCTEDLLHAEVMHKVCFK